MIKFLRKSGFVLIVILFVFFMYSDFNKVIALENKEPLTNLSKDELYNVICNSGIAIPDSFDDNDSLKDFIYNTVQKVENYPEYKFVYNYSGTVELANNIKSFVNGYYGVQSNAARTNNITRYNLQYSTVCGQWMDRYEDYNCYAYAINRKEKPKFYSTTYGYYTYLQYQPGNFSGYPGGVFTSSISIQDFAICIKTDLENIGMTNVTIYDDMPSIDYEKRLICVRKGYFDYHFMYYNIEEEHWYHKPSDTAILQYNDSDPETSSFWTNEYSEYNIEYPGNIYYDSDVLFISYTENKINLNCGSTISSSTKNINAGKDVIYEISIGCPKSYKFISNASYPIEMNFYNYDMDLQTSIIPTMSNSNCTGTITTYLNPGTYYLRINYVNSNHSGDVTTSYQVTWPLNASLDVSTNLLSYLHSNGNNQYHCVIGFNNTYGEKMFKFSLDAGSNVVFPSGTIKVYRDSDRTTLLDRYSTAGSNNPSVSYYKENEMYVFLPESGYYYIEITLSSNNYSSLNFTVSNVDSQSINYTNTLATSTLTNVFSNKTSGSYFKKVSISHRSKIGIELNSTLGCFGSSKLYIFKINRDLGYNVGVDHYSLQNIQMINLTFDEDVYNGTIILDDGDYYIGYTNNTSCSFNLNFRRIINTSIDMDGTLVADPIANQGYTIGSEVLLNGGSYNNANITEGFTRCIYLMNGNTLLEPNSRLLYDWYSSNESVAIVTDYGTILALPVSTNTQVTIYAIQKADPSIVYRKTFTVLNDTGTYYSDAIDINVDMFVEADTYTQIDLSNTIVPINMLQYYSWSISSGGTISGWGYIFVGNAHIGETLQVTGLYQFNPRVKIHINVYVTDDYHEVKLYAYNEGYVARDVYFSPTANMIENVRTDDIDDLYYNFCPNKALIGSLEACSLFYIHTHGYQNGIFNGDDWLTSTDLNSANLSRLEMALLMTCETGVGGFNYARVSANTPINIVEKMICCGAETVIGFSDVTYVSDCNVFAPDFTNQTMNNHLSVKNAIDNIDYSDYILDMSSIAVVGGNANNQIWQSEDR